MNDTNETTLLLKLRKQYNKDIEKAKEKLRAVELLLEDSEKTPMIQSDLDIATIHFKGNTIGTTQAIKYFFEQYPNKEWSPAEIRDELSKLREQNKLDSEMKDLLSGVHSVLRKFVNNEFIKKIKSGEIPVYRKSNEL